jgi:hypothetical protein
MYILMNILFLSIYARAIPLQFVAMQARPVTRIDPA